MKKIQYNILIIFLLNAFAAHSQTTAAELQAFKIASRMKDSLGISVVQRDSIYAANLSLLSKNLAIWQQYNNSDSLIQVNLQRVENTRDSLYRIVFTEQQYIQYRQKKTILLNNN